MRRRLTTLVLAVATTTTLSLATLSLGATGSTLLVSPPNDPNAPNRPTEHFNPAISADGRFTAYVGYVGVSAVGDVSSIGETGTGVFLRDISGPTTPINVPFGIGQQGLAFEAGAPSLSGNGRFLAFASEDPDLSDEDLNGSTTLAGDTFPVRDVFVYDRASGKTELVSRNSGSQGTRFNNDSNSPSISADGRYVAFGTQTTNFIRGVFGGLFIRDLRTDRTILAGRSSGARGEPLRTAIEPSISGHGRWVAFITTARIGRGRATLEIGVRDMETERTCSYPAPAAQTRPSPAMTAPNPRCRPAVATSPL
jgi:Tol biopolymer transport system component